MKLCQAALLFVLALVHFAHFELSGATNSTTLGLSVKSKKFQINFVDELNEMVDRAAHGQLNELLLELQGQTQYAAYVPQIHTAMTTEKLEQKIIYLKQLLDLRLNEEWHTMENFYTLRNLNFLSKLKKQLKQQQEESAHELRQLRWYNLCKQFWFRQPINGNGKGNGNGKQRVHTNITAKQETAKLAPYASTTPPDRIQMLSTADFGRELYARVKAIGAEIIDDYLLTLRRLLQEVVDEKHEHEQELEHDQHNAKLYKLLTEIDVILNVSDFYGKRQRLYAYLDHDLASDYEQFKNSEHAQEDLANVLAKLQNKGMDLFVTFIFSNFEFLESLHEAWKELLPLDGIQRLALYDEKSQRLFRIHTLYVDFKRDWENTQKYDAYVAEVKALYTETKNGGEDMHIFELLNNASGNVGSVTFNMIKAKCDEI